MAASVRNDNGIVVGAPPVARRANLKGFLPVPAHVPFWNVEKV
ncbi:MAG: hypothetical protein WCE79_23190 [Xanthobacteraceae bacterium]